MRPIIAVLALTMFTACTALDGYTLLVAGAPHAIGMSLYKKLNYDLARDLAAINCLEPGIVPQ